MKLKQKVLFEIVLIQKILKSYLNLKFEIE